MNDTAEHRRLKLGGDELASWRRWGPYVSERAWGSVREDYSAEGNPWGYFTHEMARSKAYRWGEDGLGAISDRYQVLLFSIALWNERDPILKERAFGLSGAEGNHGEDLKEYYFYLDSTPTHSYMKYLYKYPQGEFPYSKLVEENQRRAGRGFEYELLDTGAFGQDRYFDLFVEYAKAGPEDICITIEVHNRGPEQAPLHLIPQLWFRNTWSWGEVPRPMPTITSERVASGAAILKADDTGAGMLDNLPFEYELGARYLHADPGAELLFTNNETNAERVYGPGHVSRSEFVKDAFHRYIVRGEKAAVAPHGSGTKAGLHYRLLVPSGGTRTIRLRLTPERTNVSLDEVSKVTTQRRLEAEDFYQALYPPKASTDEKAVMRQALAGMLWSKQVYLFDVARWLEGDNPAAPPPPGRRGGRNRHWRHLNSMRVLSMPDTWEYPWFAAWDLAFHTLPLALVDPEFAKEQLWFLLFEQFQHPNGQIPAYEWEFSDLNPPVHAWAVWRVFNMEKSRTGAGDREFLERCFHKLLLNFTWWINKVDSEGNNIFEGGFLGLDNITVLDRSAKLPDGVRLEQSDATGWMGFFCLGMMRIALELAKENPTYEGLATKFFQHYVYVGAAMKHMGGTDYSLWDEQDGFFYDVLRYPDGSFHKFRVRSLVGLIPLYAVERLEDAWLKPFGEFRTNLLWFLKNRTDLVTRCCFTRERAAAGLDPVHVLSVVDQEQLRRILDRLMNPEEFLSPFGVRSLSKTHEREPFRFGDLSVSYEPAESDCKIKGGNSNWRGPIWFPTSFLLIESLNRFQKAYGANYRVELNGKQHTFADLGKNIADRLISIFTRDAQGRRPVYGGCEKFQTDPHWRDHVLFYEYFHGENGAGLGASHQTGWTGLVAVLIDEYRR